MENEILLSDILNFDNPENYKIHLANWNKYGGHPLVVFLRDRKEWESWNTWGTSKNEYNRKYIFSLIEFFHAPNIWIFGGIFEVTRTYTEKDGNYTRYRYDVRLSNQHESMIGRLKVYFERDGRNRARVMENTLKNLYLHEILPSKYEGEAFCGYENISHDFGFLENILSSSKADWKSALENVKGVYMIVDKCNGKKYVGSAYGESGIWSRWSCYIGTGHGHNNELTNLIKKKGIDYARRNFVFCLLEYRSMKTEDKVIIEREIYWKESLLSREFGYNRN